jgi:hypothetical protein
MNPSFRLIAVIAPACVLSLILTPQNHAGPPEPQPQPCPPGQVQCPDGCCVEPDGQYQADLILAQWAHDDCKAQAEQDYEFCLTYCEPMDSICQLDCLLGRQLDLEQCDAAHSMAVNAAIDSLCERSGHCGPPAPKG